MTLVEDRCYSLSAASLLSLLQRRERGVSFDYSTEYPVPTEGGEAPFPYSPFGQYRKGFVPNHFSPSMLMNETKRSHLLVEQLSLLRRLRPKHNGCVNSALFSDCGNYIFTGSDDTHVHIQHTFQLEVEPECPLYSSVHNGLYSYPRNNSVTPPGVLFDIPTRHTQNIFFAKELYSLEHLITCAADGKVAMTHLPSNRFKVLHRHVGRAHRIAIVNQETRLGHFFSCGEDGDCCLFDVRDPSSSSSTTRGTGIDSLLDNHEESDRGGPVLTFSGGDALTSIYSIGVNPRNAFEVALCGEANAIVLFDIRNTSQPCGFLCPESKVLNRRLHITGLKYSDCGEMLLASYSGDSIYSFKLSEHLRSDLFVKSVSHDVDEVSAAGAEDVDVDEDEDVDENDDEVDDNGSEAPRSNRDSSKSASPLTVTKPSDEWTGFYREYSGHRNVTTVKQVAFYGLHNEFVVSGCDSGHLFFWDTHSSEITRCMKADRCGAINCISTHPTVPLLVTCGLDDDAKLWMPIGQQVSLAPESATRKHLDNLVNRNQEMQRRRSQSRTPRFMGALLQQLDLDHSDFFSTVQFLMASAFAEDDDPDLDDELGTPRSFRFRFITEEDADGDDDNIEENEEVAEEADEDSESESEDTVDDSDFDDDHSDELGSDESSDQDEEDSTDESVEYDDDDDSDDSNDSDDIEVGVKDVVASGSTSFAVGMGCAENEVDRDDECASRRRQRSVPASPATHDSSSEPDRQRPRRLLSRTVDMTAVVDASHPKNEETTTRTVATDKNTGNDSDGY